MKWENCVLATWMNFTSKKGKHVFPTSTVQKKCRPHACPCWNHATEVWTRPPAAHDSRFLTFSSCKGTAPPCPQSLWELCVRIPACRRWWTLCPLWRSSSSSCDPEWQRDKTEIFCENQTSPMAFNVQIIFLCMKRLLPKRISTLQRRKTSRTSGIFTSSRYKNKDPGYESCHLALMTSAFHTYTRPSSQEQSSAVKPNVSPSSQMMKTEEQGRGWCPTPQPTTRRQSRCRHPSLPTYSQSRGLQRLIAEEVNDQKQSDLWFDVSSRLRRLKYSCWCSNQRTVSFRNCPFHKTDSFSWSVWMKYEQF